MTLIAISWIFLLVVSQVHGADIYRDPHQNHKYKYEQANNLQEIARSFQGAQFSFLLPDFLAELSTEDTVTNKEEKTGGHLPQCDTLQEGEIYNCGSNRLMNDIFGPGNDFMAQPNGTNGTNIRNNVQQFCALYEKFQRCIEGKGIEKLCIGRNIKIIQIIGGYSCGIDDTELVDIIRQFDTNNWQFYSTYISNIPGCYMAFMEDEFRGVKYGWLQYRDFRNYRLDEVSEMMGDVCLGWHNVEKCYIPGYMKLCGSKCQTFITGLLQELQRHVKSALKVLGPQYESLGLCAEQDIQIIRRPKRSTYQLDNSTFEMFRKFFDIALQRAKTNLPIDEKEYGICSASAFEDKLIICQLQSLTKFKYKRVPYSVVDFASHLCDSFVEDYISCWIPFRRTCASRYSDTMVNLMQAICKLTKTVKNNASMLACVPNSAAMHAMANFNKACGIGLTDIFSRFIYAIDTRHTCADISITAGIKSMYNGLSCIIRVCGDTVERYREQCGAEYVDTVKQISTGITASDDLQILLQTNIVKEKCCHNATKYPICSEISP